MTRDPVAARRLFALGLRPVLATLIAAILTPALAMAFGFGVWNLRLHVNATERGLQDTARALSLAVDRDVSSVLSAVITLASSPFLDAQEFRRFHDQATAIARPFEGWVTLINQAGEQIVNTRRNFGDPLPSTSAPDQLAQVFNDAKPIVSDLLYGKVAGRDIVAVMVPVFRDGVVVYSINMAFVPERFSMLLAEYQLPPQWYAVLVDGTDFVIARSLDVKHQERLVPPEWFNTGSMGKTEGILQGRGLVGYDIRLAFHRSRFTGWTAGVAAPTSVLTQARDHIFVVASAGAVACMALAFAVGLIAERRIVAMLNAEPGRRASSTGPTLGGWRDSMVRRFFSPRRSAPASPPHSKS